MSLHNATETNGNLLAQPGQFILRSEKKLPLGVENTRLECLLPLANVQVCFWLKYNYTALFALEVQMDCAAPQWSKLAQAVFHALFFGLGYAHAR